VSRVMWPSADKRRLLMNSIAGGTPVLVYNAENLALASVSNFFSSYESNVQVSAAYYVTKTWPRTGGSW